MSQINNPFERPENVFANNESYRAERAKQIASGIANLANPYATTITGDESLGISRLQPAIGKAEKIVHTSMTGTGWTTTCAMSPLNPNLIGLGTDTSGAQFSTDGGRTVFMAENLPILYIHDICYSKYHEPRVFVGGIGGLYVSYDSGRTFNLIWSPCLQWNIVQHPTSIVYDKTSHKISSITYRRYQNKSKVPDEENKYYWEKFENVSILKIVEADANTIYFCTGYNRYSQTNRIVCRLTDDPRHMTNEIHPYRQERNAYKGSVYRATFNPIDPNDPNLGGTWTVACVLDLTGFPYHPIYKAERFLSRTQNFDELLMLDYDATDEELDFIFEGTDEPTKLDRLLANQTHKLHENCLQREWQLDTSGLQITSIDVIKDGDEEWLAVSANSLFMNPLWCASGHNANQTANAPDGQADHTIGNESAFYSTNPRYGAGFMLQQEVDYTRHNRARAVGGLFIGRRLSTGYWEWVFYSARDTAKFIKNIVIPSSDNVEGRHLVYTNPVMKRAKLRFYTYESSRPKNNYQPLMQPTFYDHNRADQNSFGYTKKRETERLDQYIPWLRESKKSLFPDPHRTPKDNSPFLFTISTSTARAIPAFSISEPRTYFGTVRFEENTGTLDESLLTHPFQLQLQSANLNPKLRIKLYGQGDTENFEVKVWRQAANQNGGMVTINEPDKQITIHNGTGDHTGRKIIVIDLNFENWEHLSQAIRNPIELKAINFNFNVYKIEYAVVLAWNDTDHKTLQLKLVYRNLRTDQENQTIQTNPTRNNTIPWLIVSNKSSNIIEFGDFVYLEANEKYRLVRYFDAFGTDVQITEEEYVSTYSLNIDMRSTASQNEIELLGILVLPTTACPQGLWKLEAMKTEWNPSNLTTANYTGSEPHQNWYFHNHISWVQWLTVGTQKRLYWSQLQKLPLDMGTGEHDIEILETDSGLILEKYRFAFGRNGFVGYQTDDKSTVRGHMPYWTRASAHYKRTAPDFDETSGSGDRYRFASWFGYNAGIQYGIANLNSTTGTVDLTNTTREIQQPCYTHIPAPIPMGYKPIQKSEPNIASIVNIAQQSRYPLKSIKNEDGETEDVGIVQRGWIFLLSGFSIFRFSIINENHIVYTSLTDPFSGASTNKTIIEAVKAGSDILHPNWGTNGWISFPIVPPIQSPEIMKAFGLNQCHQGKKTNLKIVFNDTNYNRSYLKSMEGSEVYSVTWFPRIDRLFYDPREGLYANEKGIVITFDGEYCKKEIKEENKNEILKRYAILYARTLGIGEYGSNPFSLETNPLIIAWSRNPATDQNEIRQYSFFGKTVQKGTTDYIYPSAMSNVDGDIAFYRGSAIKQTTNTPDEWFYFYTFQPEKIDNPTLRTQTIEEWKQLCRLIPIGKTEGEKPAHTGLNTNGGGICCEVGNQYYVQSADPGIICFELEGGTLVRKDEYSMFYQTGESSSKRYSNFVGTENLTRRGLGAVFNPNDPREGFALFQEHPSSNNKTNETYLNRCWVQTPSYYLSNQHGWQNALVWKFRDRYSFPLCQEYRGFLKPEIFRMFGTLNGFEKIEIKVKQWEPDLVFYIAFWNKPQNATYNEKQPSTTYYHEQMRDYTAPGSSQTKSFNHHFYNTSLLQPEERMMPFPTRGATETETDYMQRYKRWFIRNIPVAIYRITVKRDPITKRLRWAKEWAHSPEEMKAFYEGEIQDSLLIYDDTEGKWKIRSFNPLWKMKRPTQEYRWHPYAYEGDLNDPYIVYGKPNTIWEYAPVVWYDGCHDKIYDPNTNGERPIDEADIDIVIEPLMHWTPITSPDRWNASNQPFTEQHTAPIQIGSHYFIECAQADLFSANPELERTIEALRNSNYTNLFVPYSTETIESLLGETTPEDPKCSYIEYFRISDLSVYARSDMFTSQTQNATRILYYENYDSNLFDPKKLAWQTVALGYLSGAVTAHANQIEVFFGEGLQGKDRILIQLRLGPTSDMSVLYESPDGGESWYMVFPFYSVRPGRIEGSGGNYQFLNLKRPIGYGLELVTSSGGNTIRLTNYYPGFYNPQNFHFADRALFGSNQGYYKSTNNFIPIYLYEQNIPTGRSIFNETTITASRNLLVVKSNQIRQGSFEPATEISALIRKPFDGERIGAGTFRFCMLNLFVGEFVPLHSFYRPGGPKWKTYHRLIKRTGSDLTRVSKTEDQNLTDLSPYLAYQDDTFSPARFVPTPVGSGFVPRTHTSNPNLPLRKDTIGFGKVMVFSPIFESATNEPIQYWKYDEPKFLIKGDLIHTAIDKKNEFIYLLYGPNALLLSSRDKGTSWEILNLLEIKLTTAFDMKVDSKGRLWCGSDTAGLVVIEPDV